MIIISVGWRTPGAAGTGGIYLKAHGSSGFVLCSGYVMLKTRPSRQSINADSIIALL